MITASALTHCGASLSSSTEINQTKGLWWSQEWILDAGVKLAVFVVCGWYALPNLELLGLVVLQSFHDWSESLLIVPLGGDCHGSQNLIQAAGKQRRERPQHKSQQTLLSPRWQDIYSQFSAQTPCILSSLVCCCGHFSWASLWSPWPTLPSLCMQSGLLLPQRPILTRSHLVLRWCRPKKKGKKMFFFATNVFSCQR